MAAVSSLVLSDSHLTGVATPEAAQASKLETVGRLASGVAHDFANILTLISGYTEILLERAGKGAASCLELEEIRHAANRGATLVGQLLSFARTQTVEPKAVSLNAVVTDVERMLRPIIGETIEVQLNLAPGLGKVLTDPVQMDQVVMNLLLNARDAMPSGGTISIETHDVELDADSAAALKISPGGYVALSVSDTGPGIGADAMLRLFEPFFTTKPLGKGAGLGLSTVRQIVSGSGGAVWATSTPGSGAAFHVCLPRQSQTPEIREVNPALQPATRGSEIVLVVEDEEGVRRLLTQVLRMRGYRVLEACDGEEALALFRERHSEIQLVITDVIMPKMGGPDLAKQILSTKPGLPLVFISGYPEAHLSRAGALPIGQYFLRKPLRPDALAAAVREALDSAIHPFNPQ